MRACGPALLLVAAACAGEEAEPPADDAAPHASPTPRRDAFPAPPAGEEGAEAAGAAEVARAYFGHIAARRYAEAWRLRWGSDRDGYEAFAGHFARYASYTAPVGPPRPVQAAADGSLFVDVPVQIHGRLGNGEGVASAGMVTLRREAGEPGGWRIYSGE